MKNISPGNFSSFFDKQIPKKKYLKFFVKFIFEYITKPHLKIDTIVKKVEQNSTKFDVKFTIINKRQPFTHNVNFLMENIDQFNFKKRDIAIIAFFNRYQHLENAKEHQ
ncbi:MAG: hypothetical protein K2P99_01755 [Burkholderiales bacterium]|nr:hypothetical protein [Burkholderiales bacterium]